MISLGGLMVSCEPKKTDGLYCTGIEEEAECPTVTEINDSVMPLEEECSSVTYLEVTAFSSHSEDAYIDFGGPEYNDTGMEGDTCCYTAVYREKVGGAECAIGRPFIQENQPVVASLNRSNGSWKRNDIGVVGGTKKQRQFAGQFYLDVARYEHASVASFNRFALELIKFGAPAHLVQQAQMAAMDEIRHAQSAFAIANQLLSENLQPGEMAIQCQLASSLEKFTSAVLEEAAIQETLAVLLAAEQLRIVQDPMIKSYLQEVVVEESRHSELAFATLRWCIEKGGESIKTLIRNRLNSEIVLETNNYPEQAIAALGLPSQSDLKDIVQVGIERVIRPSLLSLLKDDSPLA